MAEAKPVVVTKTVEVREDRIQLTLNDAEVRTLYAVLMRVAGDREDSPRKHIDAVRSALVLAVNPPVKYSNAWANPEYDLFGHSLGLEAQDYPA